jgi:ubiquinone/menaquinone biosynthesis C-methylase UbiE
VPEDIWSQWLLKRRFGDDPARAERFLQHLAPVRERVLKNAALRPSDTLLDVGCGDGLVAFGALQQDPSVQAIFSDVSQPLLDHARQLAETAGIRERCRFIRASADDLSAVASGSVDAVTTRSVLIYVDAKETSFREFFRVLRPGGRVSIFEPINSFRHEEPENMFRGFDVTPVVGAATKLKALYASIQPPDRDPMMNFNERDLIDWAEAAGFRDIELDLQAEIKRAEDLNWDILMSAAPNPKIPSWGEAMDRVLTATQKEAFIAHVRPQVEAKNARFPSAVAYLWAVKL